MTRKIRDLCTRYPDDSEIFALIDDLGLVPVRHRYLFCELVKERQRLNRQDRDFRSWCLSTRKGLNVRKRSGVLDAVQMKGLF